MICCHFEVVSTEWTECTRCGEVVRVVPNSPPIADYVVGLSTAGWVFRGDVTQHPDWPGFKEWATGYYGVAWERPLQAWLGDRAQERVDEAEIGMPESERS